MVTQLRSWFSEHHTLVVFLGAQLVAAAIAGATTISYFTRLDTRVSTMETRGAEYTVDRMNRIDQRITVLEQQVNRHTVQIERMVDMLTKPKQ
jgi:hypothetical protein